MIRIAAMLFLVTFAVSFTSLAQTSEKFHKVSKVYVEKAQQALNAGEAVEAQGLFERALVADPSSVTALVGLGNAHSLQGRTGRGLKYYRFALEVIPNNKPALAAQSLAFLKKGNIDRATSNQMILERLCSAGCLELTAVNDAIQDFRDNPPEVKTLEDKLEEKEEESNEEEPEG